MEKYSHIIWDWNGTLFDDVQWNINCANILRARRELKPLGDIAEYHDVFCFPIQKYYENMGFDFAAESYEHLTAEYLELYHAQKSGGCGLHTGAIEVLDYFYRCGVSQVILSASEVSNLHSQVSEFDIAHYFDEILGLSNTFAKSKVAVGQDYIQRTNISRALLIGDTVHDYEVATALGVDVLLIANGHQSKDTLLTCNVHVLDDISCLAK